MVFLKRFSARDLIFYLLAILVMVFTFNAVQQMNEPDDPTYNEIRLLFEQEKVKYFSVEDNVLTLTLRGEGEDTSTLKYHLADFNVFYNDLHELIDSQRQAGIIQDYDYPAGWAEPWWFVYVPYLVILLGFGILMYTMYLRQNTGGGGGGGPSRFGHARTRTLADQGKKVTFNDVAGADEEKEELEEIVEFLRDPQKFTALGARIPKGVLLVGPPGTGKTFAAGCLANFLIHDGKVPLVTSVSRAENVLWDAKGDERTRMLEGIRSYDLVVIDDLGAERDSSYMDSRAFDLVDACYRSGRPLVVTTNVPLAQLKNPRGLARTRIYDRVLERCQPVMFDGPSFRAAKAEENRAAVRRILDGVR